MLSIVSCSYWSSVRKWPLCVSRGKKRLYSHPWDGVPRTGKRSDICSSAGSGCLNSIWLGDCALLMGHSGLGPARFHCNETSNSRQLEGTMALRKFWGVEEGWQPCSSRLTNTRRGFRVSKSTDPKQLVGYGRWLTQMGEAGPLANLALKSL